MTKTIEEFPEYSIDTEGNVINIKTTRVMKIRTNSKGYSIVGLMKNKKQHTVTVHRLVAEAYILNPENKEDIDHKDENKTNNNVLNLRWCTTKENVHYYTYNEKRNINEKLKNKRLNTMTPKTLQCHISSTSIGEVIINGTTYPSVQSASKFIAIDAGKNSETIRKEITRRHIREGHVWTMYGEYLIGG